MTPPGSTRLARWAASAVARLRALPSPSFANRSFPRVKQHDQTDCGAACLSAIAEHYGVKVPIARIRQHASTDRRGTTLLGMIDAAGALGLSAKGCRAPMESLSHLPKPSIAQIIIEGGLSHFIVITRVTENDLTVMDPRDGALHRVSKLRFEAEWTGVLLLLTPAPDLRDRNERSTSGGRLIGLLRPHGPVVAQALLGSAVYTLLGLSGAIFVQLLIDSVLPNGNRNLLNLLGVVMIGVALAQVIIGSLKDLMVLRTGQRIDGSLIFGYYRHVLALPQRFFDSMRVGEIISRVNDAVKIRTFVNDIVLDLTVNVFVLLFSIALMVLYSWKLALLVGISLPLYAAIFAVADRLNRRTQRRLMEGAADLESQLVESISSAATIKRLDLRDHASDRMESRLVRLLRSVRRSAVTSIGARHASDLVSRLATLAVLWAGGVLVIERAISPGELMSFYALVGYLSTPALTLVNANRPLQDALIATDRLFELLDLEPERNEGAFAGADDLYGPIQFEAVTFRYGARGWVFRDLDLTIRRGITTAIVGESGSGKTTLGALLQGLYPIEQGRLRIGPVDLRHVAPETLRRVVGAVPQDVHLFTGSVIENVAIGDSAPDIGRVVQLCDELGIAEFVEKLPRGYQTVLGENGERLSGGQRQRIAIARALYRRPSILVLDEATSSLDHASEHRVQQVLNRLHNEGMTVIVIAHRLSTIRTADQIVVMEEGRVAEQGSHAELMNNIGPYRRLWQAQTGAAAPMAESVAVG